LAQEMTGAKVFVMHGDEGVIANGGKGQYLYTDSRWKPCPVDRVLKDGEKITLGKTTLVAHHTPGHTRGCTTWSCQIAEGGKNHNVVIVGSPNVNPGYQLVGNKAYPKIAADYSKGFKTLNSLECEYFLGAHGAYYGMLAKFDQLSKQPKNSPFIDPAGYRAYIEERENTFREKLAQQQSAGLKPVRIAVPVNGHIHPAICISQKGTIIVTYGRVNHRDLRITRSTDGGKTWTDPKPFVHTIDKSYYPGSLTTLKNGQILHCWNRWSTDDNEKEPRSVLYSLSSDDGLTWSAPQPFPRNSEMLSVIRHPVVEIDKNNWLTSLTDKTYVFNSKSGTSKPFGDGRNHGLVPIVRTPQGTFISGAGLRSTDLGKTWSEIKNFPNVKEQGWRHEMVCLSNGWLLASEILGPGFGGERIRYAISFDDGLTWENRYEYYSPGRAINGRACPRTVEIDDKTIGVVFYDIDAKQAGGPGLFFLRIPLANLAGLTGK